MNIGIYTRKSVYSDKSDSVESQFNICIEYIKNNNYYADSIVEYTDEGFSGANTYRPGYEKLMDDVNGKKIDLLICYKIDRLSRNVLDFSNIFNTLQQNNIQFISVKEQIDTSTPLGRAMMYICSVFAQMERETIAERIKDNMIQLAKSGKWAGGKSPFGYSRVKKEINGKKHTILAINEDQLPFLNMIFDTFLDGYSLGGLETYFRKKGIKSINNKYLCASQLYQILKNPHYVAASHKIYDYFSGLGCIMATNRESFDGTHGLVVYGRTIGGKKKVHKQNTPDKWIISVGLHSPIMSDDKWLSVQYRFGKNVIDKARKHEIGILKGIVKCKCGYTMRVQHKVDKTYNKTYDNYFCAKRDRRGVESCNLKMISVQLLDNKVIDLFKQLSLNKNLVEEYLSSSSHNKITREIDTVKKELAKTTKRIENLTNTLLDIEDSSAAKYIVSEIENLDKQKNLLTFELREIEIYNKKNSQHKTNIDQTYIEICNFVNNFENLPYDVQVKWLNKIIKECIWDGENLTVNI